MRNRYEIRGDVAVIFLRRRDGEPLECVVDAADLQAVSTTGYTWASSTTRPKGFDHDLFYAVSWQKRPGGRLRRITMHRQILGYRGRRVIDHVNGNGLDNRRCNLRVVSKTENALNRFNGGRKHTHPVSVPFIDDEQILVAEAAQRDYMPAGQWLRKLALSHLERLSREGSAA